MIQHREFSLAKQKMCSNCGAGFTCGISSGDEACWCNDLPHISPVGIEEEDCLCPRCLIDLIAKASSNHSQADDCIAAAPIESEL